MIRRITVVALILACFITTPVYATVADYYDNGFQKINGEYVNRVGLPIPNVTGRGIDVSVYQGDIDWGAVAQDDISFAFIRCGNTVSGIDKMLHKNAKEAQANGIPIGLYYRTFAPTEEIARLEANFTVICADEYGATLPLVMDIEGPEQASLGTRQLQRHIQVWCEVVEAAGYTPMVYASKSFMETYIKDTPCAKWIAQYGDEITYSGSNVKYWQCSSHGYVNGIEGRVDIDFAY